MVYIQDLVRELCLEELTVESCDVRNGDTLRTFELAGPGVGTVTEAEFIHLCNHILGPLLSLNLTLRKESKRADSGSNKEHCRTVLTGSYTSAATYTGCCIHTLFSLVVRYENVVGILSGTGAYRDESASLEYLVESCSVDYKILDYRESGAAERLNGDGSAILEMPHKQLTGCNVIVRSVSTAVDVQRAGSADTLAAVVVKSNRAAALTTSLNSNRVATLSDKLFIEDIEHLEE